MKNILYIVLIISLIGSVDAVPVGTITIEKEAEGAGDTLFDFTSTIGPFKLPAGAVATTTDRIEGDYVFTEALPTGWHLASISCTGGNYTVDGNSVTIHLQGGDHITCRFTNEKIVPMPEYPGALIPFIAALASLGGAAFLAKRK